MIIMPLFGIGSGFRFLFIFLDFFLPFPFFYYQGVKNIRCMHVCGYDHPWHRKLVKLYGKSIDIYNQEYSWDNCAKEILMPAFI